MLRISRNTITSCAKNGGRWLIIAASCIFFSCDRNGNNVDSAKQPGGTGSGNLPTIRALGNNCQDTAVATTLPGFDARIALDITDVSDATHSVGYVAEGGTFLVNFNEVVLQNTNMGTFSMELLVRDRSECERAADASVNCNLGGKVAAKKEAYDVVRKLSFIVENSPLQYLQSGSLGNGQDNVVGQIVRGEGLIAAISKMGIIPNNGNGGPMGNISNMVGISDEANAKIEELKRQPNKPVGGCVSDAKTVGTGQTAPTAATTALTE